MNTTPLDARYIAAAAICAHRDDTRYRLKGVYIEANIDGVIYVATDGHRMLVLRQEYERDKDFVSFNTILPLKMCAIRPKKVTLFNKKRLPNLAILDISGGKVSLTFDGLTTQMPDIDGTYPYWRNVVPKEMSGEAGQFNGKYFADFSRISKMLGGSQHPTICFNGKETSVVSFGRGVDGFGILMPMNVDVEKWTPPAWI